MCSCIMFVIGSPGAEASSSHPGNLIEKASVVHWKNGMSTSCEQGRLVRNKLKPDGFASGKRTKRRTLHGEEGNNKSSENDQVVEASSIPVDVRGYRVKAANAPIYINIHIGQVSGFKASNNAEDNILQLEAMETEVRDAEEAKIEVSWLQ
ncbi:hypothetical protein POM88_039539 [Heracleum sosnowskyi]|uniref:Uncharacterized protein n=1 Tax=Heracleum sosnowskyi TaxID=360622 RepID=A0AAD8M9F5_9APIA|nr:hypothetical protein POM88_039539 [Heracleum sosnowskyi]